MRTRFNCAICNQPLSADAKGVLCPACQLSNKTNVKPHNPGTGRVVEPSPSIEAKTYTTFHTARYGLSVDQQQILYGKQGGRCGICGAKKYLVLDHDHKTGKARGYLCRGCNVKLSGIDDAEYIRRAKRFLDDPPVNKLSE